MDYMLRSVFQVVTRLSSGDVSIRGAFKQIDFVKEKVLIEVQFGKYAFMFYDMAKFQYFFNENKAGRRLTKKETSVTA